MDGVPMELGVYGLFALMAIREVLAFVKWYQERTAPFPPTIRAHANGDATVGSKTVDFWKAATHAVAKQAAHDELVYPIGQLAEIRTDTQQIRARLHDHSEIMQRLAGTQDLMVRLLEQRL